MKLELGNQIRAHRRRLGLTQEQLAEKLAASPQAVSRWENGVTYPDIEMLPVLASFFGTSVDALLGRPEEEKERYCRELQEALFDAARKKDAEKTIELLREIRRHLREYHSYWFWSIYRELFRFYRNAQVLEEARLLAEEVFEICPREEHEQVVEGMAYLEDDEHIGAFLDTYSTRQSLSRAELLFGRYKMREELDKIEPVRQFILWDELDHLLTAANDWQEYLSRDPGHFKWFCETQLNYLNAVNCLTPDPKRLVSGGTGPDLWSPPRIQLGLRYTRALIWLGETEAALDAFEDTVSLLERVMAIPEEAFTLGCSSPALKTFSLDCRFHWFEKEGKEYRELCMEKDGWCEWVLPRDILSSVKNDSWFGPIHIDDPRFGPLLARLEKCVIARECQRG
ncbi:MAG: helix-turn-helix transcriptional regulator [Oscillospiraceae bacterium]|nr:helix-turn-helix transcriptional regulator [Oscillospiraceae bacterium]